MEKNHYHHLLWSAFSSAFNSAGYPEAHLQSCNYLESCDTGFMCEERVCVTDDKYNLNKWNKTATNKQQHLK